MSASLTACRTLVLGLFLALSGLGWAQTIAIDGANYALTEVLAGDQTMPRLGIGTNGGYVVWQDNGVDGDGLGIMARRLDANLSGTFGSFAVNELTQGDQKDPALVVLPGGQTAIVWQGGLPAYENIYIRFLSGSGTFTTPAEQQVNTYVNGSQTSPEVAVLANGNVVVVWSSLNQDGNWLGVYGRVLNGAGEFLTEPFQVNQQVALNQRSPAVTGLTNGNFVVVWVSENQAVIPNPAVVNQVHVFARIFQPAGQPVGNEFRVDPNSLVCANPAVCPAAGGGFTVAWSHKDLVKEYSWDIYAQTLGPDGSRAGADFRVNTYRTGDQYVPVLAALGANQLILWTSLGQDGSWEGVYAQFYSGGAKVGGEFLVNERVGSRQLHPALASDGLSRFLAVWSSYCGDSSFDLVAQRFGSTQALPRMAPPWLSALSQSRIMVTWPVLAGYPVVYYELYVDQATTPVAVTTNSFVASGFGPATTHSFRIGYALPGNQSAPPSLPATVTTWDEDLTGDGLPDDWQELYWGEDKELWSSGAEDSDGDGATNFKEFLAGTDPTNPASLLRLWITPGSSGQTLRWSARPGFIYQVQTADDLKRWVSFGPPRLAAGTSDALIIPANRTTAYYRVVRVR